jgi:hypothetical protein
MYFFHVTCDFYNFTIYVTRQVTRQLSSIKAKIGYQLVGHVAAQDTVPDKGTAFSTFY